MLKKSERLALISIYMSVFGSVLQFAVVVPFSAYMVTRLGGIHNRSDVGLWAGILAGCIMIGQALSSPTFGVISDRWGRKPVLLIGVLLGSLFSLAFGLSLNLWMAFTLRFFQGVFCSVNGVTKTLLSELCPGPKQVSAMSWFSLIASVSVVLGVVLGGLLCNPTFMHSQFFSDYPFLLPDLLPCFFCFIAFLGAAFFLEETLKKEPRKDHDRSLRQIIQEKNVYKVLMNFSIICFIDTTSIEVLSLWCYSNKKDGGFEFDPFDIGLILCVSFALFAPFQKMYFDFLCKRFSLIGLGKAHILIRIVFFTIIPLASFLNYNHILSIVALSICMTFIQSTGMVTLTSIFILTNNSIIQKERGRVNGVSMTVGSGARGVGPLFFGYIFAETAQSGLFFPLNYAFCFELFALILLGSYFLLSSLPDSLNHPIEEKESSLLSHEIE